MATHGIYVHLGARMASIIQIAHRLRRGSTKPLSLVLITAGFVVMSPATAHADVRGT
jgi:hypothetical protein